MASPLLLVVVVFSTLFDLAASLSAPPSASTVMAPTTISSSITPKIITISEKVWRKAASTHSQRIRHLLQPGLLPLENTVSNNSGSNKSQQKSRRRQQHYVDDWTGLDPINPIYNFLIEYYGLKGAKGPRRLARWAQVEGDHLEMGIQGRSGQTITRVALLQRRRCAHGRQARCETDVPTFVHCYI